MRYNKLLYHITTYGCQMNVHESEKIAGQLEKLGYEHTDEITDADIVVFNTCTIRENAVSKAYGNIGAVKKMKKVNKEVIIAVGGCMTQDLIQAQDLKSKYPYVDIIFGTHNLYKFGEMVEKVLSDRKKIFDVWESNNDMPDEKEVSRTSFPNAWVNIMYGCNNFCTYCIVPYVRGRERSRKMSEIANEVESMLKDGYKEITLLGQNVNSYGNDLLESESTFPKLLEKLAQLPYKYRLRFMTSHPKDFTYELAKVISKYDNISKFIHLPIQSGSNNVLENMNRRYTREEYLQKIDFIKSLMPDISLSTDFMVGFPGETEEDFLQTLDVVDKVRYSNAFMFIYSKRHGTKAAEMDNQIDEETKKDRIARLIKKVNKISKEISNTYIGQTVEVLVEDRNKNLLCGRTDSGRMVTFPCDKDLLGQFVNVKITATTISQLKGVLEE